LIFIRIDLADGGRGCTYQTCILFYYYYKLQKRLAKGGSGEVGATYAYWSGESAYMYVERIRVNWDFELGCMESDFVK